MKLYKENIQGGGHEKNSGRFYVYCRNGFYGWKCIAAPVEVVQLKELSVSPGSAVTFYGGGTWLTGVYNFQIQSGTFAGTYGGFCVDPANSNTNYSAYDINTISHAGNYDAAAWLLNNYYTVAGTSAVATQAAIWEVMFETNTGFQPENRKFRHH